MNEFLTMLCIAIPVFVGVFLFTGYKILTLEVVTKLLLLRYGAQIATDTIGTVVNDLADAAVKVKSPNEELVAVVVNTLNQYNLIPAQASVQDE